MQFFLLRAYLLYSLSQRIHHNARNWKLYCIQHRQKTVTQCIMHTIKITLNLLFEYQCTSGKFIRLPNRIESKLFFCRIGMLYCRQPAVQLVVMWARLSSITAGRRLLLSTRISAGPNRQPDLSRQAAAHYTDLHSVALLRASSVSLYICTEAFCAAAI